MFRVSGELCANFSSTERNREEPDLFAIVFAVEQDESSKIITKIYGKYPTSLDTVSPISKLK